MTIRILHGDMLVELPKMIEAGEQFHACCCDPPYEIGFMSRKWDRTGIAFRPDTWRLVHDALLPGAHMLCFGGTRTYHRMACAIEDAGFEIRDTLCWLYSSGFNKVGYIKNDDGSHVIEGWAGSLKPAMEPVFLARRPLGERTVAANVLRYGTGALNIDASRVPLTISEDVATLNARSGGKRGFAADGYVGGKKRPLPPGCDLNKGRWPANVLHDGSDEVLAGFPDAPGQQRALNGTEAPKQGTAVYGDFGPRPACEPRGDSGSAARFFYTAKADSEDRAGSKHPTIKPTDLIRYLVRLITPPGGCVLDPFAGTGTTGLAADQLGFDAVLIEQDTQYVADARMKIIGDAPLFAEVATE